MATVDSRAQQQEQHLSTMLANVGQRPAPLGSKDKGKVVTAAAPKAPAQKKSRKKAEPTSAQRLLKAQAKALAVEAMLAQAAFEEEIAWEYEAASGLDPHMVENIYGVPYGEDWLTYACPPKPQPEYDADGNRIIDVDLTEAQATLLNLVLDGMDYFSDAAGRFNVTEANLNLTPSQKGHIGYLHKQGLVSKQNKGWILTDKGLGLYGATWDTIKAAYAKELAVFQQQPIQ